MLYSMWNDSVGRAYLIVLAVFVLITAPAWWIAVRDHAKAIDEMHKRRKELDIT